MHPKTPIIFHIGPSKTASTSLQAIIPTLGRHYDIKPEWMRSLTRKTIVSKGDFPQLPPGTTVSDEVTGDFVGLTPSVVSDRIFNIFGRSIIVLVHRDPEERIQSLYEHMQRDAWGKN
jgi:hypothetical protein